MCAHRNVMCASYPEYGHDSWRTTCVYAQVSSMDTPHIMHTVCVSRLCRAHWAHMQTYIVPSNQLKHAPTVQTQACVVAASAMVGSHPSAHAYHRPYAEMGGQWGRAREMGTLAGCNLCIRHQILLRLLLRVTCSMWHALMNAPCGMHA